MKYLIYGFKIKLSILFMFLCTAGFVSAQIDNSQKLQGEWKLVEFNINQLDNNTISYSIDKFNELEIYSEIKIEQDNLIFDYKGESQKRKYNLEQERLYLMFKDAAFYAEEYIITDDKLFIKFIQDIVDESGNDKSLVISLLYNRK